MKSSIGSSSPDTEVDQDLNGVPDQAERDFAEDGKAATDSGAPVKKPGHGNVDDGGLESSRPAHGDVQPPSPN